MQAAALLSTRALYAEACNAAVSIAHRDKVFGKVALHHVAYHEIRAAVPLGSQLVCRATGAVADAYKTLRANGGKTTKVLRFSPGSVHYDARTMRIVGESVSLYTVDGRVDLSMVLGAHQRAMLGGGTPREAKLVYRNGTFFLHLAIDRPQAPARVGGTMGVDVGENNLAATSTGKILSGKRLCFERDRRLALRAQLQANGTQSSMQLLRKVSGREQRRVRHVNHVASKAIVAEAVKTGAATISMEDLTHIRTRIKAGKRVRARLHRWAWRQLQSFVAYKAEQEGIAVIYIDPAYTSQTCAACECIGMRKRHLFTCTCGSRRHADVNAASNIRRLARVITPVTGAVTTRHVA